MREKWITKTTVFQTTLTVNRSVTFTFHQFWDYTHTLHIGKYVAKKMSSRICITIAEYTGIILY